MTRGHDIIRQRDCTARDYTSQRDRLGIVEGRSDRESAAGVSAAGDFQGVGGVCVVVRGDRGNASKTETVAQVQLSGSPLTSEGLLFPKVRHDYFYY